MVKGLAVFGHSFCSCLIYVICVCLRILVSKAYCVVFLFCLFSSCGPYVARFSRFFILIVPSVFSNVYLLIIKHGKIYSKNAIFRLPYAI